MTKVTCLTIRLFCVLSFSTFLTPYVDAYDGGHGANGGHTIFGPGGNGGHGGNSNSGVGGNGGGGGDSPYA